MPDGYSPEEVEMYQELLGEFATGAMKMFKRLDEEAKVRSILTEDQAEKLADFQRNSEEIFRQVNASAEKWWETAKNNPDTVSVGPETLEEARTQFEAQFRAGKSVEYLHQLYYDAAKAQKRLTQIGSLLDDDLDWVKASMPTIKGLARATEKSRMGDETAPPDHPFAAGLRDLARGTIEVNLLSQIIPGVDAFLTKAKIQAPGAELTRFKNKFANPDPSGYADIQIHLRLDGGHICEMQFQCSSLLDFKSLGGSRRPRQGRAWESWDALLGDTDKTRLTEAKALLAGIEDTTTETIIGPPPEDAKKSMQVFADATEGSWFLNAHIIYNITRWFDDRLALPDTSDDYVDDPARTKIETLNTKLKEISKLAATGMRKILNAELGGSASATDQYDTELAKLAAFTLKPGTL